MSKAFYFLSPVEVMKVTTQNLEEVAEWCGGKVAETESRRVPGRMDKYVWVPTPKGNAISWAFPGMFITKRVVVSVKNELRATFAVFRRDYFEKNYFDTPSDAVDATWERDAAERAKPVKKQPAPDVTVSVGDALGEAMKQHQDFDGDNPKLEEAVAVVQEQLGAVEITLDPAKDEVVEVEVPDNSMQISEDANVRVEEEAITG